MSRSASARSDRLARRRPVRRQRCSGTGSAVARASFACFVDSEAGPWRTIKANANSSARLIGYSPRRLALAFLRATVSTWSSPIPLCAPARERPAGAVAAAKWLAPTGCGMVSNRVRQMPLTPAAGRSPPNAKSADQATFCARLSLLRGFVISRTRSKCGVRSLPPRPCRQLLPSCSIGIATRRRL